jgi:predicted component of type VI protein secretion system
MPKLVYHDSDGVDKVLNLAAEPLTIGRATECEIQTQDAMVSRKHARITWDGNYWIEDLGSSNGVYVGNEKVQKAPFRPGDTVTCGSLVMRMMPDTTPPRNSAAANAVTQPPPSMLGPQAIAGILERQRVPTQPPPPAPPQPVYESPPPAAQDLKKRCKDLELQVAELQKQLAESTSQATSVRPSIGPANAQIADTVILLSDAVAAVRHNLRAANGEATLLKAPEESAQVVRDSLRTAAEALDQARQHLRSLAKLLGV